MELLLLLNTVLNVKYFELQDRKGSNGAFLSAFNTSARFQGGTVDLGVSNVLSPLT